MRYIDGYVLPVPKAKLDEYKKLAREAGKIWKKHGALEYVECVGDDLKSVHEWGGVPFPKLANCKKAEVPIFAFVIYKSRAHRDRVNKKVMEEMQGSIEDCKEPTMPFDIERMAFGGFQAIVEYLADEK